MPVNEDNKELRDLVAETLKAKGVLGKVQAEIRASVFLALEEQDVFKDKAPFLNKPLKDFVQTSDGLMVLSLVREFLEFFNLEFAAMVFDPETHAGIDYTYEGRSKLAKDLSLDSTTAEMPLLAHILVQSKNVGSAKSVSGDSYDRSNSLSKSSKEDQPRMVSPELSLSNGVNGSIDHSKQELKGDNVRQNVQSNGDRHKNVGSRNENNRDKLKSKEANSLTSLSNLPPLNSKAPSFSNAKGNDLKTLIDIGLNSTFDVSTDNEKHTKSGSRDSDSGDSEIEEDIASHNSNASGVTAVSDDNTMDVSVSKASGHGDYMEQISGTYTKRETGDESISKAAVCEELQQLTALSLNFVKELKFVGDFQSSQFSSTKSTSEVSTDADSKGDTSTENCAMDSPAVNTERMGRDFDLLKVLCPTRDSRNSPSTPSTCKRMKNKRF